MANNNKGKIALYLPSLRGGGVERVMLNLARGFVERGFSVDLVLVNAEGPYLKEVPIEVRVINLSSRRVLTSMPGLVCYLYRERPTVMLSAMVHANLVAIWASLITRKTRIVVSVHNTISQRMNLSSIKSKLWIMLIRIFFPFAKSVVFVSEAAKNDFLLVTKLDPNHVNVIYNPVVTPELIDKARESLQHPWFELGEPPVFLAIGRLTKEKDFTTLINAFTQVRKELRARLIILGEGKMRQQLENIVMKFNVEDDVCLPGFVKNPYAYMSRAKVFVLSSETEGLPTVLIEALAIGISVVSTDCPSGPAEILNHGEYGLLVPVGDVKSLANAMLVSLQSEVVDREGRRSLSEFSLDEITTQYLEVLFS